MGCSGCSTGRGCSTTDDGLPKGCKNNGSCGTGGCNKLSVFDWLANMELPNGLKRFNIVEVRFKNSRKDFYQLSPDQEFFDGDVVAVESSPGHDIGVISLTGELVKLQLKKKGIALHEENFKKVYRKAKPSDIEKWHEAQNMEKTTMIKSRTIADKLNLKMKICDVEYQGDKTKVIFYYTADSRVDFRELIKLLADEFKVRIEMKQIGARQEAGRLGGIGSCGRELCCSTWLTDFRTVQTHAARYQQLSINPLKLAGQCGKLKCCLNFELDSYLDAIKDFPETATLKTKKGKAFHQKTDIFKGIMWYTYEDNFSNFIALSSQRVKEIIELNKQSIIPEELVDETFEPVKSVELFENPKYENVVGQDSLTRFDASKKKKKKKKPRPQGTNPNSENNTVRPVVSDKKEEKPSENKIQARPVNNKPVNNNTPNNNAPNGSADAAPNPNKKKNKNKNRNRNNRDRNENKGPNNPNTEL
jgi:cell fate regulator YaaT (PSP1 superfamily)